ncbi:MAG: hypothetical protein LBC20_08640 [Planctomycetaceae bacterium]|nr:hypothetical protein [Planctomycetaceae bacterium]
MSMQQLDRMIELFYCQSNCFTADAGCLVNCVDPPRPRDRASLASRIRLPRSSK